MNEIRCDVAIIGAGTAGLSARAAVADAGATPLMIEGGIGGTTCARIGCMPSKLLIAAAAAAQAVAGASLFGVSAGQARIDGRAVMARVRRERDHFVAGVRETEARIPDTERAQGHARFLGPNTLAVDDHTRVTARAIVIATGSRSTVPEAFRAVADRVLTNESVFELPDLPGSLAVIGAGPLGLELAQAFGRLGVRVRVFDTGRTLAGVKDETAQAVLRGILSEELAFVLGAELTATPDRGGVAVAWTSPEGAGRETFEYVLAAAGRPPNLAGLDLARAGLALDAHGVPLFDRETLRCGDSAVFVAGDADHDRPVLHEAATEGRIAGLNAAHGPDVAPQPRGVAFSIVYTDPEVAIVGGPPPDDALTGEADMRESGRARVMGRDAGLLRIHARPADNRLLGGTLIGPEIEHLGHLLAWAVQMKLRAEDLLALPFYHPTLEESLRTAVRGICKKARVGGMNAASLTFGPGA